MKLVHNIPPLFPGFHGGVCSRSGEQGGSCNSIGSVRWRAISDHTERGARRDIVCCFLCCWVSLRFVRSPAMVYRCSSVCTDWCRARRGRLPLAAPRGRWTNGNGWGSRRWIAIGWNVGTCGVTTSTKWSTAKQYTVTFFRTCCSPTISQHHLPPQIVH